MSAKKTTKPAAKMTTKSAKANPPRRSRRRPQRPTKATKTKKPNAEGKLSALDVAAKVLADTGEPMNFKAMIEEMAAKGLWTSPGGKTQHVTLYSAILREINTKGSEARFVKTERGKFKAK